MQRLNLYARYVLLLAVSVALVGCGPKTLPLVPVKGKVVMKDGSIPKGEIAVVNFEPMNPGTDTKAASGDIQSDGSFQLHTLEGNDGALVGEYRVRVLIWKTYANQDSLIDEKYDDSTQTPLTATVTEDGGNDFTFEVE